jgi:hypothetical protein
MGVDQPAVGAPDGGNTTLYCQNLLTIAPQRIVTDAPFTGVANSPDAAAATTLFTFLIQRFQTTYEGPLGTGLQCTGPGQGPIQAIKDGNGVAIAAKITLNGQTQCYMSNGTVDPTGNSCIPPTNTNNTNGNGMSQQQTQKGQNQQGQQHKSRKRRHG